MEEYIYLWPLSATYSSGVPAAQFLAALIHIFVGTDLVLWLPMLRPTGLPANWENSDACGLR